MLFIIFQHLLSQQSTEKKKNNLALTGSPLSPGIPGIPRGPTMEGPFGPLSPWKTSHNLREKGLDVEKQQNYVRLRQIEKKKKTCLIFTIPTKSNICCLWCSQNIFKYIQCFIRLSDKCYIWTDSFINLVFLLIWSLIFSVVMTLFFLISNSKYIYLKLET